jgi:hypothetical protein
VGAILESLTIAVDLVPSVLVARFLEGITFGLGPSMLLSRKALEEIGGFSAVADYLAEDYQIGNLLWKKGYRNILSSHVIENVVGRMSIPDYVLHQLRWARTYKACRPKGFLGYGITHILPFSLLLLLLPGNRRDHPFPSRRSLSLSDGALFSPSTKMGCVQRVGSDRPFFFQLRICSVSGSGSGVSSAPGSSGEAHATL